MIATSARQHVATSARGAHSFENLVVWQIAQETVVFLYTLTMSWKDYGLKDQIQRAMVSVVSNIAEGYERGSRQDFVRFLFIARGSVAEVRAQSYIARDLGYFTNNEFEVLFDKLDYIARMLGKLITNKQGVLVKT